jgi:hypothetical protein
VKVETIFEKAKLKKLIIGALHFYRLDGVWKLGWMKNRIEVMFLLLFLARK